MKLIAGSRRWWIILAGALIAYLMLAYVILPAWWSHHEHEPGLASLPMVTRTADGIPGDALNVGLVGSKEDVLRAMHAAGGIAQFRPGTARWRVLSAPFDRTVGPYVAARGLGELRL